MCRHRQLTAAVSVGSFSWFCSLSLCITRFDLSFVPPPSGWSGLGLLSGVARPENAAAILFEAVVIHVHDNKSTFRTEIWARCSARLRLSCDAPSAL